MATPKKPSGWNSLSKAQQDAWKKKNFNMKVKVTEAQLNKLRAQKTPDRAIAKYKNDPSMLEALYRFYGKARVNKFVPGKPGNSTPSPKSPKSPNQPMPKPSTKMGPDVKGRFNKAPVAKKKFVPGTGGKALPKDIYNAPRPTGNIGNQIAAPYPKSTKPTSVKPKAPKAPKKPNPTPRKLPADIYNAPRPSGNLGNQIAASKMMAKKKRNTGRGN